MPRNSSYVLAMVKHLDFDSFYQLATDSNRTCNSLSYHSCCDVWSKRGSKRLRSSHRQELKWGQVMTSLLKDFPDKKLALQAKMVEEGWRMPVLVNQPCQARALAYPPRLLFKPHFPRAQIPFPLAYSENDDKTSHSHLSNNSHHSTLP